MARFKLLASQWNHKSALHHTMLILSWDGKVQVKWYLRSQRTGTGRQWHGKMCLQGKAVSASKLREGLPQRAELQHFQLSSSCGLDKSLHVLGEYLNARGSWDTENGKGGQELSLWMHNTTFHHGLSNTLLSAHPQELNRPKIIHSLSNASLARTDGRKTLRTPPNNRGKCSQPTAFHARCNISRSVKHFPTHRPPPQISKHTAAHDTESQPHEQVTSCAGHVLECT